MGNTTPKPKRELRKFDIEVTCDKVYQHLLIARDRRINELATRERDLRDAIRAGRKSYEDVLLEMISIVNLFKFVKAAKIVLRYCLILKDHSLQICEASRSKNMALIWEMETYFQGLIWSSDKLNLTYIKEFNKLVFVHFGPEIFKEMQTFTKVDKELRQCFASIEPSPNEIKEYLEKFCARYDINDFGFGGKKANNGNGNGGQANKNAVDDLDAMLAGLKMDFDVIGQPNHNAQLNNDPSQNAFDPSTPAFIQSSQHHNQQPPHHQSNINPIVSPNDFANNQFNFKSGLDQVQQGQGFNYPDPLSQSPMVYPSPAPKPEQSHNFAPEADSEPDPVGDEQIKHVIESNIHQSYVKVKESGQPVTDPNDVGAVKEQANIDELINRLRELGVTIEDKNMSEVRYDAQRHYKVSNLDNNDYKWDFATNKSNANK